MNRPSTTDTGFNPGMSAERLLRNLKFSHFKMIVALDETGKISTAATLLNISQPAASRMIGDIEEIIGTTICERHPRGIAMTATGKALARRARSILVELREVDREITDLKSGRSGSVYLGSVTGPAIELAVPAIAAIREQSPAIEINIQVETSIVLANELLAARLDFLIARIPDDLNPRLFDARVIGVEKACLIIRKGHPALRGEATTLAELALYDWVLQPAGSLLRRSVEEMFLAHHVPLPERVVNTSSLLLTSVMVARTNAIAPVSVEVARFLLGDGVNGSSLTIVPLDINVMVKPFSLIRVRNRSLSPAAEWLYAEILRRSQMIEAL